MNVQEQTYQSMVQHFKDEVFGIVFYLKDGLRRDDVINILILLNKYYPCYTYSGGSIDFAENDDLEVEWEDAILKRAALDEYSYLDLFFNVPICIQEQGVVKFIHTKKGGLNITIERDERFGFVLIIDVLFNAFVDANYFFVFNKVTLKWEGVKTDQALAARKNRSNLAGFLKEVEELLGEAIGRFESPVFNNLYI